MNPRRTWAALFLLGFLAQTAPSQPESPPPERVIHLWVDPKHGDDAQALLRNPGPPPAVVCSPTDTSPNAVLNASQSNASLLHASWPFKTVTSAVNYIKSVSPNLPPQPPLPFTASNTGIIWKHAIIHCLPGWYTPHTALNDDNALRGNNETFPILLPPNVSIQGTSALNTVFDAIDMDTGLKVGPIFEFGVIDASGVAITGVNSFISSITLTGAHAKQTPGLGQLYDLTARRSAAVMISRHVASKPTVVNCFFVANTVGILVAASPPSDVPGAHHNGTVVMNNTFAFNSIGLWNGQLGVAQGPLVQGESRLIVLNNIFDSFQPTNTSSTPYCYAPDPDSWAGWSGGAAVAYGFIGVPREDMQIGTTNYNAFAYHPNCATQPYNTTAPQNFLPSCGLRTGSTMPIPTLNIAPQGGLLCVNGAVVIPCYRGVLYIRDIFCNLPSTELGAPPSGVAFDGSPLDFRLSPATATQVVGAICAPPRQRNAPNALNLLVDSGWSGPFPAMLPNNETITQPPGTLGLGVSQGTWSFDAWEYDCEGYGNRRIVDHPLYSGSGIDIGADELGDWIVAGYRYGTTMFVRDPAQTGGPADNGYFWVMGPPTNLTQVPAAEAAHHTHFFNPLASLPAGYNTTFSDHTWGYATTTLGYYASSPVDVHPHLVPDIHPWWFQWVPTFSFAEWRPCVAHNPVLYWNPTRNVINPPGAYLGGGGGAHAWIDYLSPLTPNVVKLANAAFAVGATGDWGTGLDISPWCIQMQSSGVYRRTWEPTLSSCVRFSLELERPLWHAPGDRNLQSFLVYRPGSILH